MLNAMMKNENKRFTNTSIPLCILFIVKLIAQINALFFLNCRYFYVNKINNTLLSKSTLKYLVCFQVVSTKKPVNFLGR